jgi:hypothetical protein
MRGLHSYFRTGAIYRARRFHLRIRATMFLVVYYVELR